MQKGSDIMGGFITEQHFSEAEREFPGIRALYLACGNDRPKTFLDLVARYLRAVASTVSGARNA
jgi:hypothetical protein